MINLKRKREEKREEMLSQKSHLNRRANLGWNPCKIFTSTLSLSLSLIYTNPNLLEERNGV